MPRGVRADWKWPANRTAVLVGRGTRASPAVVAILGEARLFENR
jgi:hypothetical protein